MTEPVITIDELLHELSKLEPTGGMTTEEVAEVINVSVYKTRILLKRGMEAGLIVNEQETRSNPFRSGRPYPANVFRVKKPAGG